jgi:methyl-accepting chemotaxis protein
MRRGAASTSRALSEQVAASDQIAKAIGALNGMIANFNRAISEQATASGEVSTAVNSMRRETEQAARALAEQTRGLKDMSTATGNTAKQLKLITHANREHSLVAAHMLDQLRAVRQITDRNARDVNETRSSTAELIKHAEALSGIAQTNGRRTAGANGKRGGVNGHG